jgi:GLPGLI family protein
MRTSPALFLSLFLSFPGLAQQPETLLAGVSYEFVHINDTTKRQQPVRENMLLMIGKTSSSYRRAPLVPAQKQPSNTAPSGPVRVVSGGPMAVVSGLGVTDVELFQLPAEGLIKTVASLGRSNYMVEAKLPVIDWKLLNEQKDIGGYTCQKAAGTYAGRTYFAWFTPDLPFRHGPWKLSGLPGLILEATDETGEVKFLFRELKKALPEESTTYLRRNLIPTSETALTRAREAFEESPVATMQAQLPAGAPTPLLAYRDANGTTVTGEEAQALIDKKRKQAKTFTNNPLERK